MASMAHLKAVEAGVDILDTCMSPYAYRNSHPAIEPLVMSLLGTNRDTGFYIDDLAGINDTLEKDILPKYKRLLNDDKLSIIDINVPLFQSPSGLFANIESQLEDMGELDRLGEVYAELAKVRRDLGEIPLVTPTNRIVAIQTVNNVLFDEGKDEYSIISAQVKDLCYGLYGETAAPINAKLIKKALKGYSKGSKPITCRPAEMIKPELPQVKEEVKGLAVDIEDELIYALFPVSGKRFLKWKYGKEEPPATVNPITLEEALKEEELIKKARAGELVDPDSINKGPERSEHVRAFGVYVGNEYFEIEVDEVGGPPVVTYSSGPLDQVPADSVVQIPAGQGVVPAPPKAATPPPVQAPVAPVAQTQTTQATPVQASSVDGTALKAPMPGMIVDYKAKIGDSVSKGDILVILEAMKMENALPSPVSGTVKAINFASGDSVAKDAALCIIE
jgi:oxaloacetate decarboxylase alpha subunit/pyruvate carboxylase subunit B